ncbi:MAG: hypothetical protein NC223_10140 [Butyrivibrio sp.]|nr:hypothetical protein [Butyrivibrio sp.]
MKKFIYAILLILTVVFGVAAFSGCGSSKTSAATDKTAEKPSVLSNDELVSIFAEINSDNGIILDETKVTEETQKEVKTKCETADELVASVLKAFCDKDAETFDALAASCTGGSSTYIEYYSTVYNDWCKAADEAGLDWKNLTVKPEEWKVWRLEHTTEDDGRIQMYYPPLSESFTFCIKINDFDYNTETYSLKYMYALSDGVTAEKLQEIDEYVNTGEKAPWSLGHSVLVYSVDIEKYLD